MKAITKEKIRGDFILFLKNFEGTEPPSVVCFHPIQCPISITEAKTVDRTVQDYSIFSLFILRMFDAGICDPAVISSVSGMSVETVETYINREKFILQHIDHKTCELTELGIATLKENEESDENARSHEFFETVRHFHIDALTGTVLPSYLERDFREDIKPNDTLGDFILPREKTDADGEFMRQINERLLKEMNTHLAEYVDTDRIADGNVVDRITSMRSLRVFYRWVYIVMLEGMRYPMFALSGKRRIEKLNAKSKGEGKYSDEIIMVPLSISETDFHYLKEKGIEFDGILVRQDSCFEYLRENCSRFHLTHPLSGEDLDAFPDEKKDEDASKVAEEAPFISEESIAAVATSTPIAPLEEEEDNKEEEEEKTDAESSDLLDRFACEDVEEDLEESDDLEDDFSEGDLNYILQKDDVFDFDDEKKP